MPSGSTGTRSTRPSRDSSRWLARAQPWVGDDQAALGADQLELVAAGQVEGDVELGEDARGELQSGGQTEVDPGVAVANLGGGDAGGFAGEQADGAGAVAAEVAEGAAAEGDRAADVVWGTLTVRAART